MDMLVRGRHVVADPAAGAPGVLGNSSAAAVLVSGSPSPPSAAGPRSAAGIRARGWWATASSC